MTKLIALAVIAAATIAPDQPELAIGTPFEVTSDVAEGLLSDGLAKLADAPLSPPVKKATKPTKVRLLIDCGHGKANSVVEMDAAAVKAAEEGGIADSAKEAVAYAMTLEQNQA